MGLLLCSLFCMACNSDKAQQAALEGNWKTDRVYYGQQDISKSSDPTNENGFWFDGENKYRRFGNPAHREEGTYQIEGEWLTLQAADDSLTTSAWYDLDGDSLSLLIPLIDDDTIRMQLHKMNE